MPWIRKKELVDIKNRIKELEYSNSMYVGAGERVRIEEVINMLISHLGIHFYKPDCNIKIFKIGREKQEE